MYLKKMKSISGGQYPSRDSRTWRRPSFVGGGLKPAHMDDFDFWIFVIAWVIAVALVIFAATIPSDERGAFLLSTIVAFVAFSIWLWLRFSLLRNIRKGYGNRFYNFVILEFSLLGFLSTTIFTWTGDLTTNDTWKIVVGTLSAVAAFLTLSGIFY